MDENGKIIFVDGQEAKTSQMIDKNFDRLYQNLYKKFMTSDKTLLEKITYMDDRN